VIQVRFTETSGAPLTLLDEELRVFIVADSLHSFAKRG